MRRPRGGAPRLPPVEHVRHTGGLRGLHGDRRGVPAVLDGEKVDADVHQAESVEIRSGVGNPVTGTDGSFTAPGCGLWVQLPALEPGEHSLEIRDRSGGFSVGVDHTLTVDAA
ncbi:hypothetical protein ACBR38_13315 [Streptomyces sp. MAD19A]|uniref:hypothetical protein n=1 Tax=Streptomyces sp. MAD19A TaxID=3242896 RepID=UPI003527C28B